MKREKESVEEKMIRKREILKRACSIKSTLVEMSQNGSSYEMLLEWHKKIHNLDIDIEPDNKICWPPLQRPDTRMFHYKLPIYESPPLFCLPPKCGTTSYQRALASEIATGLSDNYNGTLKYQRSSCDREIYAPEFCRALKLMSPKYKKTPPSSDKVHSPEVYLFMNSFIPYTILNPML